MTGKLDKEVLEASSPTTSSAQLPPPPRSLYFDIALAFAVVTDLVVTYVACLGNSPDGTAFNPLMWGSVTDFRHGTADIALLSGVRAVSAILFALPLRVYIRRRQRNLTRESIVAASKTNDRGSSSSVTINEVATERRPLLAKATESREAHDHHDHDELVVAGSANFRLRPEYAFERAKSRQRQVHQRLVNIVLGLSFLILTLSNCVIAIKCMYFNFRWSPYQEVFVVLAIFLANAELFMLRFAVQRSASDYDIIVPSLHPHPLIFNHEVVCTRCDLCNTRIVRECFDCASCDLNVCLDCFRKKNLSNAENLATRSDKGPAGSGGKDAGGQLSPAQYVMRGLGLMKSFWHLVVIALTCLTACQIIKITLPNFQGEVIDAIVHNSHTDFWAKMRMFIGLSTTSLVLGGLTSFCVSVVTRKVAFETRRRMFHSIVTRDIAFFDGATVGALTARMTNDTNAMVTPLSFMINSVLGNIIMLCGALVMCLIVSWRLATIAWTIVGPIIMLTGIYARWSRKLNRRVWDSLAEGNNNATQAFTNIRTVRAFSTERLEMAKFNANIRDALDRTIRDALAVGGVTVTTGLLELGANAIILGFGGVMVMSNSANLSVGNLFSFTLYMNMMNSAFQALDSVVNQFTRSAGAAERVLSMLDGKPDIDVLGGEELNDATFRGEIEFKDVTFWYQMRPNQVVLRNLNLVFHANSVCAIVGKSGGGKSTVMHLLSRFYDPKGGVILVDGRPMTELSLKWLHERMAVVAQDTQLFSTSIEDNITYGLERVRRVDMEAAAKLANAHDFIMSFPDGYQTQVGERGVRLSGGQRQRIAIARALLRRPRILILDESTASLDAESEAMVQESLDKMVADLHSSCTIIIVAHRLSTVRNADKIIVLADGQVVEEGRHDELCELRGAYYNLVSKQLGSAGGTAAAADAKLDDA